VFIAYLLAIIPVHIILSGESSLLLPLSSGFQEITEHQPEEVGEPGDDVSRRRCIKTVFQTPIVNCIFESTAGFAP